MCENCDKALGKYEKKEALLWREYDKKPTLLWKGYWKKEASLLKEYKRKLSQCKDLKEAKKHDNK